MMQKIALFLVLGFLNIVNASNLIVGGKKASAGEYPFNVSIRDIDGLHFCGGTLISDRLVLTAAHCVDNSVIADHVIIGANQLSDKNAEKIKIKSIILNDKWDSKNNNYDLAIIVLKNKSSHQAITINNHFTYNSSHLKLATIIGFGLTTEQGHLSNDLLYAQVPLVSYPVCKAVYDDFLTESMFCAGFSYGGVDSCQTDSGGGIFFDGQLIGVISWGTGCARPGYYGVYAKTSQLDSWIQSIKNKTSF